MDRHSEFREHSCRRRSSHSRQSQKLLKKASDTPLNHHQNIRRAHPTSTITRTQLTIHSHSHSHSLSHSLTDKAHGEVQVTIRCGPRHLGPEQRTHQLRCPNTRRRSQLLSQRHWKCSRGTQKGKHSVQIRQSAAHKLPSDSCSPQDECASETAAERAE